MQGADQNADAVDLTLSDVAVENSEEVSAGIVLDFDVSGRVVGIEILDAPSRTDGTAGLEGLQPRTASRRLKSVAVGTAPDQSKCESSTRPSKLLGWLSGPSQIADRFFYLRRIDLSFGLVFGCDLMIFRRYRGLFVANDRVVIDGVRFHHRGYLKTIGKSQTVLPALSLASIFHAPPPLPQVELRASDRIASLPA